jgi:putative endonuclease
VCADSTRKKGSGGEELARKYLKKRGFVILDLNYSARTGEIDIIAREGDTIVFVEVKTAAGTAFGDPLEWIPFHKQRRIVKTSLSYLSRHGLHHEAVRFDVVAIDHTGRISHVRDAFSTPDDLSL